MDKDNHTRPFRLLIIVICILLIIILLLALSHCSKQNTFDAPTNGQLTESQNKVPSGYFNLKLNPYPELKAGKLNLRLENQAGNHYAFKAEITLNTYKDLAIMGDKLFIKGKGDENFYRVDYYPQTKSYKLTNIKDTKGYTLSGLIDDSKVVYTSPVISPGEYLDNCTIHSDLVPGKYYATVEYTLYSPNSKKEIGKINARIVITAK